MDIKEARKRLLKNKKFREEYYKHDLALEMAKILIEARIIKNVTQEKLAKMIGTKQPSIARIERGERLPSLSFLQKIAKAFKTHLIPPKFAFMEDEYKVDCFQKNTYQKKFHIDQEGITAYEKMKPVYALSLLSSDVLNSGQFCQHYNFSQKERSF